VLVARFPGWWASLAGSISLVQLENDHAKCKDISFLLLDPADAGLLRKNRLTMSPLQAVVNITGLTVILPVNCAQLDGSIGGAVGET